MKTSILHLLIGILCLECSACSCNSNKGTTLESGGVVVDRAPRTLRQVLLSELVRSTASGSPLTHEELFTIANHSREKAALRVYRRSCSCLRTEFINAESQGGIAYIEPGREANLRVSFSVPEIPGSHVYYVSPGYC